jgi:shikimate dehydrogenase
VVNATRIGLHPDRTARVPAHIDSHETQAIVCDVIPNPPRMASIRDAKACGCTVIDKRAILVNQSAIAIKHRSGLAPDSGVMDNALGEPSSDTVGTSTQ